MPLEVEGLAELSESLLVSGEVSSHYVWVLGVEGTYAAFNPLFEPGHPWPSFM